MVLWDTFGVGYFFNELGDPLAAAPGGRLLEDATQGVEVHYRVALASSVGLTVDGQWTDTALRRARNAFLLGSWLHVDF